MSMCGCSTKQSDHRRMQVQIKHGDVLVLGSDGLFDNLSDEDGCGQMQISIIGILHAARVVVLHAALR